MNGYKTVSTQNYLKYWITSNSSPKSSFDAVQRISTPAEKEREWNLWPVKFSHWVLELWAHLHCQVNLSTANQHIQRPIKKVFTCQFRVFNAFPIHIRLIFVCFGFAKLFVLSIICLTLFFLSMIFHRCLCADICYLKPIHECTQKSNRQHTILAWRNLRFWSFSNLTDHKPINDRKSNFIFRCVARIFFFIIILISVLISNNVSVRLIEFVCQMLIFFRGVIRYY